MPCHPLIHMLKPAAEIMRKHGSPGIPVVRPFLAPYIQFIPDAFIVKDPCKLAAGLGIFVRSTAGEDMNMFALPDLLEHSVIGDEACPGRGDEGGELLEESQGIEEEVGGAVGVGVFRRRRPSGSSASLSWERGGRAAWRHSLSRRSRSRAPMRGPAWREKPPARAPPLFSEGKATRILPPPRRARRRRGQCV